MDSEQFNRTLRYPPLTGTFCASEVLSRQTTYLYIRSSLYTYIRYIGMYDGDSVVGRNVASSATGSANRVAWFSERMQVVRLLIY